ncbi:hypothetical protein Vadar_027313 [Vaccinium darrowii]|uniref:Uncharacterized protein n=1 Tax=Vaccinium darrowii TaxID=229202 RepID=A0ACB7YYV4_9ERIC|nr:hypothetical protein Vadar_027313 [Vaccinium darrowii]
MLGEWWNNDLILDGTPESDLDRLPNDAVVQRATYGAFNGTRLREMGVQEVVVTGVMTNLCCEATARQAFNVGTDNPTAIIKADAVCDDADTCEATSCCCCGHYRLAWSNPDSKTADVKGLVRIILIAALGKANTIFNQANDLLKKTKDRLVRQSLNVCVSVYEEALDEIADAIANVGINNSEAIMQASATIVDADTCEESFSNSPFKADNNAVKQLAAVAGAIIDSLG